MKKGLLTTFGCGAMALACSFVLVGCTPASQIITAEKGYQTQFSADKAVKFFNPDEFVLTYEGLKDGIHKYTATGEVNTFTASQAQVWGGNVGDKYAVVRINLGAGNTAKLGWTATPATALGAVDGTIIKESSASATGNGYKPYVLALTHSDMTSWRYEVQANADKGVEASVHVIDFSAFYTPAQA